MAGSFGFRFDNSYTRLPEVLYSRSQPQPAPAPQMMLFNQALADSLGLDSDALAGADGAAFFSGNALPPGSDPIAQAYAGHQFGHLAMLGDGRAILLGEQQTPDQRRIDIQLKGAGRTRFSRGGDGRAAVGPMLREYLISEAMHALHIPTTRSLAVVATGEPVYREDALPGAVLTRTAASHLRVGTFQYAAGQQDPALLTTLVDYTLERHYPHLLEADNRPLALLDAVMEKQIDLVVQWMRVGFIHGVMNTDNVTLSGETIDYGPCAFMDHYDQDTVFSSIDHQGRYAFSNQPMITQWNLGRFAETLLVGIDDNTDRAIEIATDRIKGFSERYSEKWLAMMRSKLGLFGAEKDDTALISELLAWMKQQRADHTNTFRDLIRETRPPGDLYSDDAFIDWHQRWQARLARNPKPLASSLCLMRHHNPAVIPRNHQVERALQAASDHQDLAPARALLDALRDPYQDRDGQDPYRQPPAPGEQVCQTFCGT
ncbi:hypothetical protein A11A3_13315 [Alcanivorax hongdengensis A-11-3]|uniref:Protein nucleotidyltransferase YdiU n=1 Tax=Alcanivorax hongdengensis A-11-3 TaxID=1177179 RepID=L0W965_9GAMM|nr:YdiU family protein [Alcanivorax hongdengensis]EKF73519.1 hypothetical protein A11A3_13315 [Alcanivorax hongdengensis A-11-3]